MCTAVKTSSPSAWKVVSSASISSAVHFLSNIKICTGMAPRISANFKQNVSDQYSVSTTTSRLHPTTAAPCTSLFQPGQVLLDLTTMSARVTQARRQLTGERPPSAAAHVSPSNFNSVCLTAKDTGHGNVFVTPLSCSRSNQVDDDMRMIMRAQYLPHHVLLLRTDVRPLVLRLEPQDLHCHKLRCRQRLLRLRVARRPLQQLQRCLPRLLTRLELHEPRVGSPLLGTARSALEELLRARG